MKNASLVAVAAVALACLTACSSDGDAEPASGSASSGSPGGGGPAGPALHLVRNFGDATYCVNASHKRGDWAWTGVRLRATDDATITDLGVAGVGVDIVGAWVATGGGPDNGAFVPWRQAGDFLDELDWADRTEAEGATLTAGSTYTLVVRVHPTQAPATVDWQSVGYRSGDGLGSVRLHTKLEFKRSC